MDTISDSTGIRGSVESLIGGRKENQDSYGMAETRLGLLVAVCDGMGGGPAGKTASMIATQAIIDYVSGAGTEKSPFSVLADAVLAANEEVLAEVAKNPSLKGMGTTCVCLLICKDKAYIVHVGDSRCYQLRGDKVVFRTSDHSYVGEMVRHGTLTEEEARTSPYSNVITRAIGASQEVEPQVDEVDYKPGDRFALMSDGIWGAVPEPQLIRFLSQRKDPAELVPHVTFNIDSLGADNGGGHDNLTLAIVDIPSSRTVGRPVSADDEATLTAPQPPAAAPLPPAGNDTQPVQPEETSRPTAIKSATPEKPIPSSTDDEEKTDPIRKKTSSEKKKPWRRPRRKLTPAFWGVLMVLVCCAAGVAYLLYFKSNEPDAPATGGELIEKVSDNLVKKGKSDSDKKKDASKDTQIEAPATNGNESFKKAAETLQNIRDMKPQKGQKRGQVEEVQKSLYMSVESLVQKGVNATSDENKREKAENILKDIKKDRRKITQLDKNGFPTGEAHEYIDRYKNQLNSLLTQ